MPEITFLFGCLFGIAAGRLIYACDKARMRWLEQERQYWRDKARAYRKQHEEWRKHG